MVEKLEEKKCRLTLLVCIILMVKFVECLTVLMASVIMQGQ
jgi:hypothetical protein